MWYQLNDFDWKNPLNPLFTYFHLHFLLQINVIYILLNTWFHIFPFHSSVPVVFWPIEQVILQLRLVQPGKQVVKYMEVPLARPLSDHARFLENVFWDSGCKEKKKKMGLGYNLLDIFKGKCL